jgi:hypothetical protein
MRFIRLFLLLSLVLLGACSQPALPTIAPTPTIPPATATATITPTRTPLPTLEPTSTPMQTISDDPSLQSQIRIVHASPSSGPLDIYVERLALINGLSYGQRTTASPIIAGTYTVSIVPSGGRVEDGALLKLPLDAKGQEIYAVVIYGMNADLKAQIIPMDLSPLKKTESRVRLFNTFQDGSSVSLVNTLNDGILLGDTAANTLSAPQAFTATNPQVEVRAGTIPLADVDTSFAPLTSTLVVLAGTSTDRATMKVITLDAPVVGEGRVRLLGGFEGLTTGLDVYADDVKITGQLGANVLTEAVTLNSGTYNLTVYPAGADRATTDAITGTEIQIGPDQDVIVAIFGTPESIRFESMVEDTGPVGIDRARIVFFNPVTDATRVSVSSDVLPEIVPVNYGRFSAPYDIPARTTSFTWTQNDRQGNLETLETALDMPIKAGEAYLYIFNARGMVNFDFLYSRTVGESASVVSALITPTPVPATLQPAPRLRMVNAIPDQFVEFRLDDEPIVRGLQYANASPSVLTQPGERTLTAHSSDGTRLLARVPLTLEPNISYTAYLYGESAPYELLITQDVPLYDVTVPSFRVVNLSTDPQQVSAGITRYIPQSPTAVPVEGEIPSTGYSIPAGIERLSDTVAPETASEFQYMRGTLEPSHTIFALDTDLSLVVETLFNVQLSANMAYDIVIFKTTSAPLRAFIVTYPPA